ncbi:MAG: RNA polymerase sigma factor [Fimbriimonas sp.]|nr:RNA polymerase sigma factor [Fimbriimonas sp.]
MTPTHATDLELAHRIASGDAEATESFVRKHYARLYRFMHHLTRHVEDAQDLTQQAFIQAKNQIASYRGKASLRTWLYRIALHEYTHWRRKRRKTASLDSVPPTYDPSYEACIEAEILLAAITRLPERLKEAFLLAEVEELPLEEVAKVLHVPVGTIKSRLFHARRRLCMLLNERQENEIEAKPILEA